ncbi:prevent-host-death family protein [Arthrobacter agilis]|nr:prevent-host-death family protein [Arthrobacter agilis]
MRYWSGRPGASGSDGWRSSVDEADKTHEIIQITRHGHPSAVLMSADDLESLQETIHWLSQPGIREDLAQARQDITEGSTVSGDDLRREFGLPPR